MTSAEWTCSLPGVNTTVGVAREGQLIGCVCGMQVRPQHLQSCLVGCFDSVGVKKGSKEKAQAKAVKWLKSEERRQLGGLMTHWSYVTIKGHGTEMSGGSDARYAIPGTAPILLPWQTAHQALRAARTERNDHAGR
jgi:hypothetical protein